MNKNSTRTEGDTIISYFAAAKKGMRKQQVLHRVLCVRNLSQNTSVAQLTSLFALDATPYLQKWSAVQIEESEQRNAKIICPGSIYDDLRKLSGVELDGNQLVVEGEVDGEDEGEATVTTEQTTQNQSIAEDGDIL